MVQAHHDISDALLALKLGPQRHAAAAIGAIPGALIAVENLGCRSREGQAAHRARDVAEIVPPHEIALVADARCIILARGQQQARRFDATGGDDEAVCGNGKLRAFQRPKLHTADGGRARFALDLNGVRVEQHTNVRCAPQPLAIAAAEMRGRRKALEPVEVESLGRKAPGHLAHTTGNGVAGIEDGLADLGERAGGG